MMFKGKPTKVIITGEAKEEFDDLNKSFRCLENGLYNKG